MTNRRLIVAVLFAVLVATPASLLTSAGTAHAALTDITSAGPLTDIFIGDALECQVAHTGDAGYEMYNPGSQLGSCGTSVLVGSTVYGRWSTALTPVSQSAVTGSGTSGSPYQVVTVADAGATGIRITQTDKYVVGDEFYRTDIQINNSGNSSADLRIYRGADCYLGGSDSGYGYADPVGKVVACTQNVNNSPPGRIEEWTPITPADHYYEAFYSSVISAVTSGSTLPDTCGCSTLQDNGAALEWDRTVGAGSSTTVSHFTTFSPLGVGAPTPTPGTPTTGTPTVPCSQSATAPCKTHTPTVTPTETDTPTSLPVTDTPVPPTVAPTNTPLGGTAGVVHGPDTGTGATAGRDVDVKLMWSAIALLIAGAVATATAVKARR